MQLVQDADILDHYGSLEIWLNFQYCALSGWGMERSWEFYAEKYGEQITKVRALLNFRNQWSFR